MKKADKPTKPPQPAPPLPSKWLIEGIEITPHPRGVLEALRFARKMPEFKGRKFSVDDIVRIPGWKVLKSR